MRVTGEICLAMVSASVERSRPSAAARRRQRRALDQLHHEREHRRFLDAHERRDVGMVQRGQGAGLALESRTAALVEPLLRQHFERNVAAQPGVARPIHLALAPPSRNAITS
jgi:hypothetical protein